MNRSVEIRNIAVAMACCLVAASCSTDGDTGTALPGGKYPMTFTTTVDGLTATRANTAEGAWTTDDRIAVRIGTGINAVKQYHPISNAVSVTLAGVDTDNTFYWQSSSETKSVTAWYCGDGSTATGGTNATALPASWAVQADQSGPETGNTNYQRSDFLYVAKEISFSDATTDLTFYHQTAKVIINIKNAEAATTAGQISSVTIGDGDNLALSGTYTAPAASNTAGTWTPSGSGMGTVTPKDITTSGGTYLKSYAALVIPQDMKDQKFIAVTLSDGNTYYYTPAEGEANLTAGNVYTYDITVKYGYLEVVSVPAGNAWGEGGNPDPVTSVEFVKGYSASDLKIGDYYYSDGKTSDGGYRKYAKDNTTAVLDIDPVLKDESGKERWVIGIIFYVGDVARDDVKLKEKIGKTTDMGKHGLVVALKDASGGTKWASSSEVQAAGSADLNLLNGYSNTVILQKWNEDHNDEVLAVKVIDEYAQGHSAPDCSSGWYLPSAKELSTLCSGWHTSLSYSDYWGGINNEGTPSKRINSLLDDLNTNNPSVDAVLLSNAVYLTSTFRDYSVACTINFGSGFIGESSFTYSSYPVRAILAF